MKQFVYTKGKLSKFSIKYFRKKKTKNRLKKANIKTESITEETE